MSRWRKLVLTGALTALPAQAAAAGPLGSTGDPIQTSAYAVDLTGGPVISSTRLVGLAGAYVALADGVDGDPINPAAPAVRVPWSFSHVDYDLSLGITVPSALTDSDYFNTGERTVLPESSPGSFVFVDFGANLQIGTWGVGVSTQAQSYTVFRNETSRESLEATLGVAHLLLARSWLDGQLITGVGSRTSQLAVARVDESGQESSLFEMAAVGFEVGVLIKPNGTPFRIGAAARTPLTPDAEPTSELSPNAEGDLIIANGSSDTLFLPRQVTLPWELSVGLALQFGPRPLNPRWINPKYELAEERAQLQRRREARGKARAAGGEPRQKAALDAREATDRALEDNRIERLGRELDARLRKRASAMARPYLLVSTELLMQGPSKDAVGVESFLGRVVNRSGSQATFSPRLGLETEAVAGWLRLRGGTYGEPARADTGSARLHGTLGFDVRVLSWSVFGLARDDTHWRVSGALDAAPRYLSWSLSLGVWH